MLPLGVRLRKIRIIVLQHLVLVAVTKLTRKKIWLRTPLAFLIWTIILNSPFTQRLIRSSPR